VVLAGQALGNCSTFYTRYRVTVLISIRSRSFGGGEEGLGRVGASVGHAGFPLDDGWIVGVGRAAGGGGGHVPAKRRCRLLLIFTIARFGHVSDLPLL
jgi:hypothetical protein